MLSCSISGLSANVSPHWCYWRSVEYSYVEYNFISIQVLTVCVCCSFSPTCVLEPSGQVSCDRCQEGYTGTNCERLGWFTEWSTNQRQQTFCWHLSICVSRCASGFYGNPQVMGGTCVHCECHGNVNVSEAGHCDIITGECLRCLGNTAGRQCEVCQPGYYGDAVYAKDCQGETHTHTVTHTHIESCGSRTYRSKVKSNLDLKRSTFLLL